MWRLLEEVADYPDGEPWDGDPNGRVYGLDGAQWPRLSMSVGPDPLPEANHVEGSGRGLRIHISAQKDPEHWWVQNYPLPVELVGDMIELLEVYRGDGNDPLAPP